MNELWPLSRLIGRLLALWILDQNPALRPLDKDDEYCQGDDECGDTDNKDNIDALLARSAEQIEDRPRHLRNNARKDDQRDPVTNTARRDLLTHPHQEHRTARECGDRCQHEEPLGQAVISGARQAHRNAEALNDRKGKRQITGILVDLFPAGLAFLLELLKRRHRRGHHLNNDRGGDVRHHVEREDTHPLDGTAGKHIHVAQAYRPDWLANSCRELIRVNPWQRDVCPEPV